MLVAETAIRKPRSNDSSSCPTSDRASSSRRRSRPSPGSQLDISLDADGLPNLLPSSRQSLFSFAEALLSDSDSDSDSGLTIRLQRGGGPGERTDDLDTNATAFERIAAARAARREDLLASRDGGEERSEGSSGIVRARTARAREGQPYRTPTLSEVWEALRGTPLPSQVTTVTGLLDALDASWGEARGDVEGRDAYGPLRATSLQGLVVELASRGVDVPRRVGGDTRSWDFEEIILPVGRSELEAESEFADASRRTRERLRARREGEDASRIPPVGPAAGPGAGDLDLDEMRQLGDRLALEQTNQSRALLERVRRGIDADNEQNGQATPDSLFSATGSPAAGYPSIALRFPRFFNCDRWIVGDFDGCEDSTGETSDAGGVVE
ncbi:hypothetical protein MNV49_006891 [Pseudohyphozyma bogoriensis]|nr:hypothetical protein MNV49_006891 [Pseudohyphozyma bogoriensis]